VSKRISRSRSVSSGNVCGGAGAAYSAFEENEKGSLTSDKCADFVVPSEDPSRILPGELSKIAIIKNIRNRLHIVTRHFVLQLFDDLVVFDEHDSIRIRRRAWIVRHYHNRRAELDARLSQQLFLSIEK